LGVEIEVGQRVTQVEHTYTHFRITLHAFECRLVRGRPHALQVTAWRWARLDELDHFAFAVTDRRIIRGLKQKMP